MTKLTLPGSYGIRSASSCLVSNDGKYTCGDVENECAKKTKKRRENANLSLSEIACWAGQRFADSRIKRRKPKNARFACAAAKKRRYADVAVQ